MRRQGPPACPGIAKLPAWHDTTGTRIFGLLQGWMSASGCDRQRILRERINFYRYVRVLIASDIFRLWSGQTVMFYLSIGR